MSYCRQLSILIYLFNLVLPKIMFHFNGYLTFPYFTQFLPLLIPANRINPRIISDYYSIFAHPLYHLAPTLSLLFE